MNHPIVSQTALGFRWTTVDPYLFCVHHLDRYPKGNEKLGPAASLAGRQIGQDFDGMDGWRMYHGDVLPGFPQHPHRGFETITITRRGYIDHSDSLGATARYGLGDVQWLTAGGGIVHAEMFPLLDSTHDNPVELFQIWLNLPAERKMVPPHFTMFWDVQLPRLRHRTPGGSEVVVRVIAGELAGVAPLPPPPDSWAASAGSDVAIWSIELPAGATWTLPAARLAESVRTLYFFSGTGLRVGDSIVRQHAGLQLAADRNVELEALEGPAELLLLQGKPIGQPIAQYGPFVMNTNAEIQKAFADYQKTQFGGWPWKLDDPVHTRDAGRFAKHADGRVEKAPA